VFVDVEAATHNIDPELVSAAITPATKAILAVHQVGMPCDMTRLLAIAEAHDLPVVEDAACAIGSEILWDGEWQRIGRPHGRIACFSFHPRKVISTGDGGMLTTDDPELNATFRLLRQHGMSVNDRDRHGSNTVVFEEHSVLGFNYRMTDIQAAVGREQLRRLPDIVAERRKIAAWYDDTLDAVENVATPFEPAWARSNYQSYVVRLPDGVDQRTVMQAMLDRGISTRRGIMCAHREKPYAGEYDLPRSEASQDRHIVLPLFPGMTHGDVEMVAAALADSCQGQD
jgi:dTDP-4-amino-4,6-dideoxygalactose transaminase